MSVEVSLAAFARALSCPQEPLDEEALELLAVARSRELTDLFLERHGEELDPGLASVLGGWSGSEATMEDAWDPAFGPLEQAIPTADAGAARLAAARLALRLQAGGRPGAWSAELDPSLRLRWGPWLLPEARRLSVDSDGELATLEVETPTSRSTLALARRDGEWSADATAPADPCPVVTASGTALTILTRSASSTPELAFLADQLVDDGYGAASRDAVGASVELLEAHAPGYLAWVGRVLRDIVPIRTAAGAINSGSNRTLPASCHVSVDVHAAALAEMLVHEATHNYFYLAMALGPVEDGTDTTLYYSPVKRRGRPIQFILLAYHAFANVLLLMRELREAGYPDPKGYVDGNEEDLIPQLDQLREGLTASNGLTPLGEALWRPLAERLD